MIPASLKTGIKSETSGFAEAPESSSSDGSTIISDAGVTSNACFGPPLCMAAPRAPRRCAHAPRLVRFGHGTTRSPPRDGAHDQAHIKMIGAGPRLLRSEGFDLRRA